MAKTKKKSATKKRSIAKKRNKKVKWDDAHKASLQLLNEELEGLISYLRTLHSAAIIIILASAATLIFSLRVLFENGQHAVVAFITIILTSVLTFIFAILALHPRVIPRFLLPIDIGKVSVPELLMLFKEPEEYLNLLKKHIELLTENFLLPKINRIIYAITIFLTGVSIATILSIALP